MLQYDGEILDKIYSNSYPSYMSNKLDFYSKKRLNYAYQQYKENNDPVAANIIGFFYHGGKAGMHQNLDEAIKWYTIALEKGKSLTAALNLGQIYTGRKQFKKAFNLYIEATKTNNHIALSALGLFYQYGWNDEQNPVKALHYYQLAYKYGNLQTPIQIVKLYKQQKKYLKALLMLIKVIIIVIPKRIYSLLNGTMEEKIRMI